MSRQLLASALLCLSLSACQVTSHATEAAKLGTARTSQRMIEQLSVAGPLQVETVVSSDWAIARAGLINLDHPRAKAAHLEDGEEPIQVFFHVIKHPTRGTFIVDAGVQNAQRDAPESTVLGGMAGRAMNADKMRVKAPLGEWLTQHHEKLSGVLMTHLHLDHVLGLPDVPRGTPIYVGPGEAQARAAMNVLVQSITNEVLEGHGALRELAFSKDTDGRFAGVLDLFGDGSLWAIHTPGHTPGSVAYLARTTSGPVLLTGDTCHTKWGWQNDVEPGEFTSDHDANAQSLKQLRRLVKEHPNVAVRLGHQTL